MKIGIGIVGGTGFGAGEILRLLTNHPNTEIVSVVSSSEAGQPVNKFHPFLNNFYNINFSAELDYKKLLSFDKAVVFLALPDEVTPKSVQDIIKNSDQVKIIDLSGCHRLNTKENHEKFYPEAPYLEELRKKFVYGLVEINKEQIKKANYIANPGCHVTACSLAVAPFNTEEITSPVVFDSKTGTSGGGRKLADVFHHPRMSSNSSAYKILSHRHEPEIRMALGDSNLKTFFVPHLLPVSRGILATAYFEVKNPVSREDLLEKYITFYKNHPFVRVSKDSPELRNVVGSNYCDISVYVRDNQVVAIAAIDNLVKGMAGVAIQNMNLICGLPETTGLLFPAVGLV